jgi:hypothetical protein
MQTDPEYVRVAAGMAAEKIIRERVNLDQIAEDAVAELKPQPPAIPHDAEVDVPPISDDW